MASPIRTEHLTEEQAKAIRLVEESHFDEVKGKDKSPKTLTEDISAFANADEGDLYIGITDKERIWDGITTVEAANGFLQCFEEFFPLGTHFHYDFLQCDSKKWLVLHVHIIKLSLFSEHQTRFRMSDVALKAFPF